MHNSAEHDHNHETPNYDAQAVLIDQLSKVELYAQDAPISQYLQAKIDVLCGDEQAAPTLYVVHDEEPNACVIGDVMIINSGILELVDYEEELDAVLAHELIHDHKDHDTSQAQSSMGALGIIRTNEIEADLRAMTRMSDRGINPRGMVSMFEKLDEHTTLQQQLRSQQVRRASENEDIDSGSLDDILNSPAVRSSPTHGNSKERAINVEQAAWLFDMPSLSTEPLTPLSFDKQQLGQVETQAPQHDLTRRQAEISRAARRLARQPELPEGRVTELIEKQAQLLAEVDPLMQPEQATRLAYLSLHKFKVAAQPQEIMSDTASMSDVLLDINHPALLELVGSFDNTATRKIAEKCIYETLRRGNFDQLADFMELAEQVVEDAVLNSDGVRYTIGIDAIQQYMDEYPPTQNTLVQLGEVLGPTRFPLGYDTTETMRTLTKTTALSRIKAFPALQDAVENTRLLARYQIYGATDMGPNFLDFGIYEFQQWHEFRTGISAAELLSSNRAPAMIQTKDILVANEAQTARNRQRAVEDFAGLAAEKQLYQSCLELTPAQFADQLSARADLSPREQQETALLWCRAYVQLYGKDAQQKLALLPLIEVAHSAVTPSFVSDIITELVFQHMAGMFGDKKNTINRREFDIDSSDVNIENDFRIRSALEKAVSTIKTSFAAGTSGQEKVKKHEFIDELVKTSREFCSFQTIAALEALIYNRDARPIIGLTHVTTPATLSIASFTERPYYDYARRCWNKAASKLINAPDLMQNETKLHALLALSVMSEDVAVNLHVPAKVLEILVERCTFDEAIQLVFADYAHLPGHVMRHAVDVIIERKAKTPEEFAIIEDCMLNHLENFINTNQTKLGVGSIIETNVIEAYRADRHTVREVGLKYDEIEGMDSVRLIRALLMSSKSDEDLKKYVFERWWIANRSRDSEVADHFVVEDIAVWRHPSKAARRQYWENELPRQGSYAPLADTLDQLYLSNNGLRYAAVRKLMLGEGGVLTDKQGRESLTEALMQSWLNYEEGSEGERLLRNILSSLMESATPERLYHYVGPILQDLILHPPSERSSTDGMAAVHAQKVVAGLVARGKLGDRLFGTELPAVERKISNLIQGSAKNSKLETVNLSQTNQKLLQLFGGDEAEPIDTISPTELALMTGKKSGAIGVRMLQLAGQYYSIPEEEREKYNEVYDSMKGQSRLQAYKVLTREAERNPQTAEVLANIRSFDERIGGGSLMTMYKVTMNDDSIRVLGVRNPNAEYHVVQIAELASNALDQASHTDPQNNDLKMAQSLVYDSVTWISRELNDADFSQKDAVFRVQNDTLRGNGFSKGNSRYDVYVPQAHQTGSLWIRHEDYVPGVNLNSLTVTDDTPTNLSQHTISRADYQDAVSTLVRSALHQINHGDFVHSDMHQGNFRITSDNKAIAVFDRYNLIKMTSQLRSTLQNTIGGVISGDREGAVKSLLQHVVPDDASHNTQELAAQIAANIEQETDPTKAMTRTVLDLKKANITIPIELSLILRNIFSLSRLSQEAGFANIAMAFLHTAGEQEIEDLVGALGDQ